MPAFDFNNERKVSIPQGRKSPTAAILDLKGLDLVTPVDLMVDGHSPFAKNFRLYAQQSDDRRVAVSSRKGPGFYIEPLGEAQAVVNTATAGATASEVGVLTNIHYQKWTAGNNDRLTRLDLKVGNGSGGSGPLLVSIYSDVDGLPGALLSQSSISNGVIAESPDWVTARFHKAVKLTSGTDYWFVINIQDDGKNTYQVATTTTGTFAYITNSSLASGTEQEFSMNFRTYTAVDTVFKGSYRFARDNGNNITLVAHGTTMYYVDEVAHALVAIVTGLSASATEYVFANGDNKVFWVNGYDDLMAWDGTLEATNSELITNGTFEVNATGWTAGTSDTATRVTSDFHSGVASLNITAASTNRSVSQAMTLSKSRKYHVKYWAKGASGTLSIAPGVGGTPVAASTGTLTGSWQSFDFYWTPSANVTAVDWQGPAVNWFLDDVSIKSTGIEVIIDAELPILSQIIFHKDRIWGVTANDPNKLVFSENPGNPSDQPTTSQWYYAWLSVSYWYVPRPHNGSPVTGLISFQDGLHVFTQDRKYVISGYDRGTFFLREATGNRGALSHRGIVADENSIFFVSDDGLYEYNGSADKKLSERIAPLFDGCPNKEKITPIVWKGKVRFYMASRGSAVNDICLLYNKELQEFEFDTDTYVDSAVYYGDADDEQELIEFSSLAPVAFLAEQDYNSLGAPIDFEYQLSYNSLGSPAQRKRILKFFPLFQGVDSSFPINIEVDRDFQNSPRVKEVALMVNGMTIGDFTISDDVLVGGATSFKMNKLRFSGYGYYWQPRISRKAVNNRVAFIGVQFNYKIKRI